MKVEKLVVGDSSIGKFKSVEGREEFLAQCINVIRNGKELINSIESFIDCSMDEEFMLLVSAEEFLSIDITTIYDYMEGFSSCDISYQRRLSDFNISFKSALALLDNNTSVFCPFSLNEKKAVLKTLKEAIGHLVCYTFNYFGFKDILDCKGDVDYIYDCVDNYMRRCRHSMEYMITLSEDLYDLMLKYNPSMGVFEKYPDLVEPFSAIVGVDFYELDCLDLATIMDVVSGKISPVEFEKLLEKTRIANGDI